jgi:hypothetical protein
VQVRRQQRSTRQRVVMVSLHRGFLVLKTVLDKETV